MSLAICIISQANWTSVFYPQECILKTAAQQAISKLANLTRNDSLEDKLDSTKKVPSDFCLLIFVYLCGLFSQNRVDLCQLDIVEMTVTSMARS